MNFAELLFWEVLAGGLALIGVARWLLRRCTGGLFPWFDKVCLLLLGLVMLLCVSWVTFLIYLIVIVVTYVGLAWIQKYHARHAMKYLILLVPLQLLPLFYYKYADFVLNGVFEIGVASLGNLLIPVGISFYSFQLVSFVVDTLVLKHPLPGFVDCMNFAGFFPQLVAGPIERRDNLLPQMEEFRFRWLPEGLNEGAGWIVIGFFFKCCLADNLALYFDHGSTSNPYLIWLANVLFGLRIYYDFAGYSLVAFGLGRCLGIKLTLNFTSPYCASSIAEFWRRWHITLSQWFRDYIYVPLGGGRTRWWAATIVLVFIVSGVWHGAGWNFVLWGALHAVFLMVNRVTGRLALPGPLGWALTMVASFYAWLCFYEVRTDALLAKLRVLASPAAYQPAQLREAMFRFLPGDRLVLVCLLTLTAVVLVLEWWSVRRRNEPYHYLRRPWVLAALVLLTVLLAPGRNNGFIYFAF